jgi:GntR family transcriptional regulator/MocR family aminotransferase
VLFPSLRLAYLVVPESQIERFEVIAQTFAGGSPELTQAIVTAFIQKGHFARHIQRMRKLYAERRSLTAAALTNVLGDRVSIDVQPGGMHLVLRLNGSQSDRAVALRMRDKGLAVEALTDWTMDQDGASALLLNFTNVGTAETAELLARRILELV